MITDLINPATARAVLALAWVAIGLALAVGIFHAAERHDGRCD